MLVSWREGEIKQIPYMIYHYLSQNALASLSAKLFIITYLTYDIESAVYINSIHHIFDILLSL